MNPKDMNPTKTNPQASDWTIGQPKQELLIYKKTRKLPITLLRELVEQELGWTEPGFWKSQRAGKRQWQEVTYRRPVLARIAYESPTLLALEGYSGKGKEASYWVLEVHKPLKDGDPTFIWCQGREWIARTEQGSC